MYDNNYGLPVPFATSFAAPLGLGALLTDNMIENDYFNSLPEEVQEEINGHADEIRSAEDLHREAENLMRKA